MSDMEIENETTVFSDMEGDSTVEVSEKEEDMSLEGFSSKEKRENDGRDSKEEPTQKKSKLGDEENKEEGVLGEAAVLDAGVGGAGSSSEDKEINLNKVSQAEIEVMEGKIERMRTETDDEDGEEAAKKAVLGNSPNVSPIKTTNKGRVGELGMTPKKGTPRRAHSTPTKAAATSPRRAVATPTRAAATPPRQGVATPTRAAATPPRQGVATPTEAATTPRQGVATTTEAATTPRQGVATTTEAATTPRQGVATTTEAATTPRQEDTPRVNVATGSRQAKAITDGGAKSSSEDEEFNLQNVLKANIEMMERKTERMRAETDDVGSEEFAKKDVLGNHPVVSLIMAHKKAEIGGTIPKKGTPKRDPTPTEAADTPRVNFSITEKGFRVEIKAEMEIVATSIGKSGSPSS